MPRSLLIFLGLMVGGAIVGYGLASLFVGDSGIKLGFTAWQKLLLILALFPAYLFVIGVHELGHLAAGYAMGFSFRRYIVGPFQWQGDDEGQVRFRWNKNFNLGGGAAVMIPQSTKRLAFRFRWFAAGGPLASIALGILFLGLPQVGNLPNFAWALMSAIGFFSLVIAILTLIPSRAGGLPSDGMRILTLGRKTPTARADMLLLRALALSQVDGDLSELPLAELRELTVEPSVPNDLRAATGYFAYQQLLVEERIDEATTQLDALMQSVARLNRTLQAGYHLEAALFHLIHRKDLETGRAFYEQFEKTPFTNPIDLRLAEAALAKFEGQVEQAQELLSNLESLKKDNLVKGSWKIQTWRRDLILA